MSAVKIRTVIEMNTAIIKMIAFRTRKVRGHGAFMGLAHGNAPHTTATVTMIGIVATTLTETTTAIGTTHLPYTLVMRAMLTKIMIAASIVEVNINLIKFTQNAT